MTAAACSLCVCSCSKISNEKTYIGSSAADRQPINTGKVDQLGDVVATVDTGSEALWEDDNELSLLLDRPTHLEPTDLPQLVRRHLVSDDKTNSIITSISSSDHSSNGRQEQYD